MCALLAPGARMVQRCYKEPKVLENCFRKHLRENSQFRHTPTLPHIHQQLWKEGVSQMLDEDNNLSVYWDIFSYKSVKPVIAYHPSNYYPLHMLARCEQ